MEKKWWILLVIIILFSAAVIVIIMYSINNSPKNIEKRCYQKLDNLETYYKQFARRSCQSDDDCRKIWPKQTCGACVHSSINQAEFDKLSKNIETDCEYSGPDPVCNQIICTCEQNQCNLKTTNESLNKDTGPIVQINETGVIEQNKAKTIAFVIVPTSNLEINITLDNEINFYIIDSSEFSKYRTKGRFSYMDKAENTRNVTRTNFRLEDGAYIVIMESKENQVIYDIVVTSKMLSRY